jgi:putative transcription factor
MNEDWDKQTIIRKKAEVPKVTKGAAAINAARRAGAVVGTERKGIIVHIFSLFFFRLP